MKQCNVCGYVLYRGQQCPVCNDDEEDESVEVDESDDAFAKGKPCHDCGKPATEMILWSRLPTTVYRPSCYECAHDVGGA